MPLGGLSFSVVPPQSYMFLRRMGVVSTALPAWAAPVPATSLIFTLSKTLALIGLLSSTVTVSELQSTVPAVSEVGVALSALMTLPPWEYWPLISVLPALLAKVIGCIPVKSTVAEPSGLIVRVKPPPPELLISAPATLSVRSMPVAFQVPTRHAGTAPPLELATPVGAVGLGLPPAVPPLVDVHPASARPKPPTITASRKMRMFSPSPATASATDLIPIDQAGQPANRLTCPAAEDREAPALEEAVHVKETRGT